MQIKKDDTVVLITGKDKGKKGKVLKAIPKKDMVIVEGINLQTKHQKQTKKAGSEIKHQEGPVHISNVMFWDTKGKQAVKIGYKIENGKKTRISKKTGQALDK